MKRVDILKQRFPLIPYAVTYYTLQELAEPTLEGFYNRVIDDLYQVFYDYIPLACFGESRHSIRWASNKLNCYTTRRLQERAATQSSCVSYYPQEFMPLLHKLFTDVTWYGQYGGKKWGIIAGSWLRREELSKELWVHQVLGLMHNGGYIFDKSHILNVSNDFVTWMNARKFRSTRYLADNSSVYEPLTILRTTPLSIRNHLWSSYRHVKEIFPVYYVPVKWGKKPLDLEIV